MLDLSMLSHPFQDILLYFASHQIFASPNTQPKRASCIGCYAAISSALLVRYDHLGGKSVWSDGRPRRCTTTAVMADITPCGARNGRIKVRDALIGVA